MSRLRFTTEPEGSASERLATVCANLRAYYDHAARPPLAEVRADEEIVWFCSGGRSFFNSVGRIRATPARAEELIGEAIEQFTAAGASRFAWRVDDGDRPRDLRDRLLVRGFRELEVGPMMTLDLRAFGEAVAERPLAVRRVDGARSAADWSEVVLPAFGLSTREAERHARWLEILGFEGPARSFVGYRNRRPVAGAQLFLHEGVAGLYWVATAPSERRKGYGTQVTAATLRDAVRLGARTAVLHANEPAIGMYERLGFRGCGSVVRYLWTADAEVR
jgi:ribosomal protein S18 acetylase RimI-like enzyme